MRNIKLYEHYFINKNQNYNIMYSDTSDAWSFIVLHEAWKILRKLPPDSVFDSLHW